MSYLDHFGLEREPFSNAPDGRFYFSNAHHDQALTRLKYAVDSNKGLAVLIGGVGTGKTTLARRMLDNLPKDRYESSLLVMIHSGITPEWLLYRIAFQLGVENPAKNKLTLLRQLYERLSVIENTGRRAVVLIDEAQMLQTRELMEEFRGLLNLEIPGKKLLNIIFFGLPEVEYRLRLDEPLAQRVAIRYQLHSFSLETTRAYIRYRLQVAGARRMPFQSEAVVAIHQASGGVPRLINTVCDNSLLESFLEKAETVNVQMVESVAENLGLRKDASEEGEQPTEIQTDTDEIDQLLDGLTSK